MAEAGQTAIKAALIGCGQIGSRYDEGQTREDVYTHAGMYHRLPQFRLAALCDRDERRLRQAGEAWPEAALFTDPARMLAEAAPQVVSVATPDPLHAEHLELCLSLAPGGVVFCEKPLAGDAAGARRLLDLAREAKSTLVVDYVRRWERNHQEFRRALAGGELGRVQAVVGYYVRGLRHNGCHLVNLAQYFLGPAASVQAVGARPGEEPRDALLTMADGTPMHLVAVDRLGYSFSIFEMEFFCQKGRVRFIDGAERLEEFEVRAHPVFDGFNHLAPRESRWPQRTYGGAMLEAGRELALLATGQLTESASPARDALSDLEIFEAIQLSAAQGCRVAPTPHPGGGQDPMEG